MKQLNRWVLSCQDQVANIWYGQDHTVYGLNPTAGPQQPDNSNTVTVYRPGQRPYRHSSAPQTPVQGIPRRFRHWFHKQNNFRIWYQPADSSIRGTRIEVHAGPETAFQPVPTRRRLLGPVHGDQHYRQSGTVTVRGPRPEPRPRRRATALRWSPRTWGFHLAAHFHRDRRGPHHGFGPSGSSAPSTGGKNASGLSFWGADLTGRDLTGWNLTGCDFARAVSLSGCNMWGLTCSRPGSPGTP